MGLTSKHRLSHVRDNYGSSWFCSRYPTENNLHDAFLFTNIQYFTKAAVYLYFTEEMAMGNQELAPGCYNTLKGTQLVLLIDTQWFQQLHYLWRLNK